LNCNISCINLSAGNPQCPGFLKTAELNLRFRYYRPPNPADTEPRPPIPDGDIEATRAELAELRRRMTRRTA
jgi:hypothetical protein